MNYIHFKQEENGGQSSLPLRFYSFAFNDLLIYAFIKATGNVMTSNHIWAKNVISNKKGKHGRWNGYESSHRLVVLPVVLGYIIWVSVLWPWCVSVPPNVRGVGWWRGATEGKPSGEFGALSLCVIQYHACVPMNGCQEIWVQSQGTSHGRLRLVARTRRVGESHNIYKHTHTFYILMSKINKKGNCEVKSLTNKFILGQNSSKNQADF